MLTQIDVVGDNDIAMPVLGAAPRDSLIVQSVTGLGPPDKDLYMGTFTRDGGTYGGRRVNPRNPVMNIQINPNFGKGEDAAGLRDILYKAFNDPFPGVGLALGIPVDGDSVLLVLHDDIKDDRYIQGYCEKFDGESFSQDLTVSISMICPDPYIRDVNPTLITPDPASGIPGWTTVPFTYSGTAEAGFEVTIPISIATSTLTLDNNGQTMVLTYPFLSGDSVYINTIPGQKQIQLTRGGVTTDILYTLYSQSTWLTLHSISNTLQVYATAPTDATVAAISSLKYTNAWWGV